MHKKSNIQTLALFNKKSRFPCTHNNSVKKYKFTASREISLKKVHVHLLQRILHTKLKKNTTTDIGLEHEYAKASKETYESNKTPLLFSKNLH